MAEWTPEATEYLEGYLKQVSALARGAGEDGEDVASGLREHITEKTEREAGPLVTLEILRRTLAEVGAPEEIVDNPATWKSAEIPRRTPAVPVEMPPPPFVTPNVGRHAPDRSGRFLRWTLGCLVLVVVGVVVLPIAGVVLGITLPSVARSRDAARRAGCQANMKHIVEAFVRWEADHPDAKTYPQKMSEIYPKYIDKLDVFTCPSMPERNRDAGTLDEWSAYEFNPDWSRDRSEPLIREKLETNHQPHGRNLAYGNGRVEFHKADATNIQSTTGGRAEADHSDPIGVARAFVAAVADDDMDGALQLTAEDQRSSFVNEWSTIRGVIPQNPKVEVTRLDDNRDADVSVSGTNVVLHVVFRDGTWWMAR